MLIHSSDVKKAADCCITTLKSRRIECCVDAALALMRKDSTFNHYIKKYMPTKNPVKEMTFETAMDKAWEMESLDFLYGKQMVKAKELLFMLKAVKWEYMDLSEDKAVFVGKWL